MGRAAALHREAAAIAAASRRALERQQPEPTHAAEQHEVVEQLRSIAARLAPGWLGAPLGDLDPAVPLGACDMPPYVRIGTALPLKGAHFPVIVPLLTHGHLTFETDARDPHVAALLRAVVLRLLAAAPAGTLHVRTVDPAGPDEIFAPFAPLAGTGLMPPAVTDLAGLRAVLDEAEQWVRSATGRRRRPRCDRLLLLAIAGLPERTDAQDLDRITALARAGPPVGVHLLLAGWPASARGPAQDGPPAPSPAHGPLPLATGVSVDDSYAVISAPSDEGIRFGVRADAEVAGVDVPVFLDDDPPAELIGHVCRELAAQVEAVTRLRLADLIPDGPQWTEEAAEGLATVVGFAGDTPVTLRFNDMFPHWMVGGRAGAGRSAFLLNVLFGLATRYPPDQLALYLLDFADGATFGGLVSTGGDPTWLPHARAIGIDADREYGLAVLRDLAAELEHREEAYEKAGVARFGEARAAGLPLRRILCVIDEFQVLFEDSDRIAAEALALLGSLARSGRSYGIHLLLASRAARSVGTFRAKRDPVLGQFPVRIALAGGGDVLDPANEAAVGLPVGAAVVNTAGGFGGPRRATRGHETVVAFPDPYAEPEALAALRQRVLASQTAAEGPPHVFIGYAEQRLADDPTFARLAPAAHPTALIGRMLDVEMSTVAYPLDATPGRHLAVLGPSSAAIGLLEAATLSVAAQHAPGSARFLLVPLAPDTPEVVAQLAAELEAQGHEVSSHPGPVPLDEFASYLGLPAGVAQGSPTPVPAQTRLTRPEPARERSSGREVASRRAYLVLFGADLAELERKTLRTALRHGPASGCHVFGWWRGLRRFTEHVGPTAADYVAGLVFLNVPGADVAALLGRPVDWRSRPNRALLHDRHADRTAVFVPFSRSLRRIGVPV
jgi:hypothetical protein